MKKVLKNQKNQKNQKKKKNKMKNNWMRKIKKT